MIHAVPFTAQALPSPKSVEARECARNFETIQDISRSQTPIILRGFVSDWPIVEAAGQSDRAAIDYLLRFDKGLKVPIAAGPSSLKGRLFYNQDFTGLNSDRGVAYFSTLLEQVYTRGQTEEPPVIYMASMDFSDCVPGFGDENEIDFGDFNPLASIWIGTPTRIAAHNDLPMNIACVAVGKRRFTLFSPDQTENLYPGPFELTPAGRPISLVDFHAPDLDRFPRFAKALKSAYYADLEAGDALFIPSMWWHHVEAFGAVNVLVNYWWRSVPDYLGTPQDALNHAMLTLRDLPAGERKIWRDLFDYYVFDADEGCRDHIPPHVRGMLNPIDEAMAKRMRDFLRQRLDR